jgi:hypothetical protein
MLQGVKYLMASAEKLFYVSSAFKYWEKAPYIEYPFMKENNHQLRENQILEDFLDES